MFDDPRSRTAVEYQHHGSSRSKRSRSLRPTARQLWRCADTKGASRCHSPRARFVVEDHAGVVGRGECGAIRGAGPESLGASSAPPTAACGHGRGDGERRLGVRRRRCRRRRDDADGRAAHLHLLASTDVGLCLHGVFSCRLLCYLAAGESFSGREGLVGRGWRLSHGRGTKIVRAGRARPRPRRDVAGGFGDLPGARVLAGAGDERPREVAARRGATDGRTSAVASLRPMPLLILIALLAGALFPSAGRRQ